MKPKKILIFFTEYGNCEVFIPHCVDKLVAKARSLRNVRLFLEHPLEIIVENLLPQLEKEIPPRVLSDYRATKLESIKNVPKYVLNVSEKDTIELLQRFKLWEIKNVAEKVREYLYTEIYSRLEYIRRRIDDNLQRKVSSDILGRDRRKAKAIFSELTRDVIRGYYYVACSYLLRDFVDAEIIKNIISANYFSDFDSILIERNILSRFSFSKFLEKMLNCKVNEHFCVEREFKEQGSTPYTPGMLIVFKFKKVLEKNIYSKFNAKELLYRGRLKALCPKYSTNYERDKELRLLAAAEALRLKGYPYDHPIYKYLDLLEKDELLEIHIKINKDVEKIRRKGYEACEKEFINYLLEEVPFDIEDD